jgi:hypothetical protein
VSRIVQEKFEVHSPRKPEGVEGSGWVSDASARDRNGLSTRNAYSGRYQGRNGYNDLPPGSNIDDQSCRDIPPEPMAGSLGTGTQATDDVNTTSLREGFDRKQMRPTDDMYTREHNDAFYDSVEVDGVEGFVERNNYLDRL